MSGAITDLARFEGLLRHIAGSYFLPGGDFDDLLQEARIGAWKALRDYRPERGPLDAFVALCARRQCITAVKVATRQKHRLQNEALRADALMYGDEEDLALVDVLVAHGTDPARIVEERERLVEILDGIATRLSPLERRALIGFVNGSSMLDLGVELGGNTTHPDGSPRPKRVENALIRARAKLPIDPPTVAVLVA